MRILLVLGLCIGLAGCARAPSEVPKSEPTPVTVSLPVEREVTDFADFTGRTAAVDSVELRARVWGYLDKVNFKEAHTDPFAGMLGVTLFGIFLTPVFFYVVRWLSRRENEQASRLSTSPQN